MRFAFDEDQEALRAAVASYLEDRAGVEVLKRTWAEPSGAGMWGLWPELAAMGVQGLLAPEGSGGSGFGWVAAAAVLAECGRAALPLPVLETMAVGVPALVAAGDPLGALPGLLDGTAVLSAAEHAGALFPASSRADWFLVCGPEPTLYRRDEVGIEAVRSVDATRDTARLELSGAGTALRPRRGPDGAPDPGEAAALATSAVLVGLGRALVGMTAGYVKDRRQFGVPVGSFQAVKHHLADAHLSVEFAAPAVWAAAWEAERGSDRLEEAVSLAKALSSDAAERAARIALQCHGAMGYTDEYHLHIWLKRVWCLAASYGSARRHRARMAARFGLTPMLSPDTGEE